MGRDSTQICGQLQQLARHCEPSLTMRYTHTQLDDKVRALDALPPASPDEQDAEQSAVA